MAEIKANLYRCSHCNESGTCRSGENGHSCAVCIKANELRGKGYLGLPCGVCGGVGQAEPATERLNKRAAPLLAIFVVIVLLAGIFAAAVFDRHFSEVLAFSAGIIGTVFGFYFSNKSKAL